MSISNTPTAYDWARVEEGYERSAFERYNADGGIPEYEENIDQLMGDIEDAIHAIRHVCNALGDCKKCIYLDEDGCALKVKEWNA